MASTDQSTHASLREQFSLAMQYMQAGNPLGAQVVLQQIVSVRPGHFEALHFLGVTYAMGGDPAKAEELISKAVSIKPDYAEAINNLGKVFQNQQKFERAADCFSRAAKLQPQFTDAYFNLGLVSEHLNRWEEALSSYDKVISLKPGFAPACTNRGVVLEKLDRWDEALQSHDRAIALQPDLAEAHGNRGDVLKLLNRLDEALASYDTAISLRPGYAGEYWNRGDVLEKMHKFEDALASYDKAIALKPDFPIAHSSRGNALEKLHRYEEAIASRDKAIELAPGLAEAHYNRAHTLQLLNRMEEALDGYRTALKFYPDYREAQNNIFSIYLGEASDIPLIERTSVENLELDMKQIFSRTGTANHIFDFRVVHDLEQSGYLLAHGYEFAGLRQAHHRLQEIYSRYLDNKDHSGSARMLSLTDEEARDVNTFRKASLRYQVVTPIEHCLNPGNDWRAIEERYFSSYPEMIYFDDFLSSQALEELRKFCLISTLWKIDYDNQYLGAFVNGGFVSPLHMQIAKELKLRMPRIFGPHKLEQLWAFKYGSKLSKGINVHADFAKVNLNFWIMPDHANLDPESGGLVVYDAPCPPSWDVEDYNQNEKAIYEFLEKQKSGRMKVPYKCNRAVLFNSALFHETDEIHFKEGYENRRINITYLFGTALKTY